MPRSLQGLTLLEVLIAIAVLGVVFGVLASMQATTLRVTADSRDTSNATDFAVEELELAVRQLLSNYDATVSACPAIGTPEACTAEIESGRGEAVVTVRQLGDTYLEEGLVLVRVDVTAPAQVSLSRVVSCMDVSPPPSVATPGPCPPAVIGGG